MTNRYILFIFCAIALIYCTKKVIAPSTTDFSKLTEQQKRLPENAMAGMTVPKGLELTLFASEPMMINPTDIAVDERGRVWVCEALNYRNTHNPENPSRKEGDRILILEDTNGDGKADKNTVFFQDTCINAALGIWAVGNRAVVSCSPFVFAFTDTNGDDKADKIDTLFTGIDGVQSDHAVHAFTFGPDGKYYFNFGNNAHQIKDKNGKAIVDLESGKTINNTGNPFRQGMVLRCNTDGTQVEVLGHNFRNNYEVAADSYGTMWQSDNDDDGNKAIRINYVMPYGNYGYTDEMTGAGWSNYRIGQEDKIPARHWHQNDPGSIPNMLFTGSGSPCGIAIYEGDLLPEKFQNTLLHAEAGHNVVRSYPIKSAGAGYSSEMVDFVKGLDEWFRPSDVCTAPDGSIFIADWYDPAVGGHKFGDVERGRIYRVAPKGNAYKPVQNPLKTMEDAIEGLKNPNLAVRELAWLKLHNAPTEATPLLEKLFQSKDSKLRARALWLLTKNPATADKYFDLGLKDADENVRIATLRSICQTAKPKMLPYLQAISKDPSVALRREAILCLRFEKSPEATALWANLAAQYDGKDRWYLEALGIGSDLNADACFAALQTSGVDLQNSAAGRDLVWRSRSKAALPFLTSYIKDPKTSVADMKRYFRAFDFHKDASKNDFLASLLDVDHPMKDSINSMTLFQINPDFAKKSPAVQKVLSRVLPSMYGSAEYLMVVRRLQLKGQNSQLLKMALTDSDYNKSTDAADLLVKDGGMSLLVNLLGKENDKGKMKILSILGRQEKKELFAIFTRMMNDKKESAIVRRAAMDALQSSWQGEINLLYLVETGKVPAEFKTIALSNLSQVWNTDVRIKARKLLNQNPENPASKFAPVAVLQGKSGDIAKGKEIYSMYCALCHQARGEGNNFGPSLDEIGSKLAKDALYSSILYPSSGINLGYEGWKLSLKDKSEAIGIIESRTDIEIVLRLAGGIKRTLKMNDIAKIEQMTESLMPDGLYRAMSEQDLVDLVEYLGSLKSEDLNN
jgi:putative membrane-bound dehydrogenase-like protein